MSLERPTIVLFDMDGTTVRHVNPRLLGVLEFMDDLMFKTGRLFSGSKDDLHLLDDHGEHSADASRVATQNPLSAGTSIGANKKEPPKKTRSLLVHRALHKMRKRPVEQIVQPCPGIYALLNLLNAHRIPVGVVSNGLGKGYGYDILEKFALAPLFKTSIFREDFTKSKPHPDPLLRALKDLKDPLTKDDVIWYIGDRHKDITAALAADALLPATIIPFAYGLNASVAVLEKGLPPEQIIMNYHDFTLTVRHLLGKKKNERAPEYDDLTFPAPLNDNDPIAV